VIGEGSADTDLNHEQLSAIVEQALEIIKPGERILAIIPIRHAMTTPISCFP
jgi:hypothetical protein